MSECKSDEVESESDEVESESDEVESKSDEVESESDVFYDEVMHSGDYTEAWFLEQPALSEEMAAAEIHLKEAETRYRQVLDRVCALSSPRVAFERRLAYLERTSQWDICSGMISGEPDEEETGSGRFGYGLWSTFFDLDRDRQAIAYLSQDHGNFVASGEQEQDKRSCFQKIYLSVLPDPESLTVDELKEELEIRELSNSGEKADLVARLQKLKKRVEE
jgi:hypothetical protein